MLHNPKMINYTQGNSHPMGYGPGTITVSHEVTGVICVKLGKLD